MKKYDKLLSKQFLVKEYINNKKSMVQIAKEKDFSTKTIYKRLKKYGIRIRSKSEARKGKFGKNTPGYKDGRCSKKYYCKCGNEITYKTFWEGKKQCYNCFAQKKWGIDKEKTVKQILDGLLTKPNKPEKLLNKLLQEILANEYKINVRGDIMILGGKVPDFVNINGQKKIIELYGDYWHSDKIIKKSGCYEDTEKGRIKYFKKYGYKTLIVWEHELKNLNKVKKRILKFNVKKESKDE